VSGIKLPLTLSLAGHAFCLALLIMLFGKAPPLPEPVAKGGIEVVFQPALPKTEKAPLPEPPVRPETSAPPTEAPPPEPQSEPLPPVPQSPAIVAEPTPPAPEAAVTASEPPPPPHKPAVKRPQKSVPRHLEAVQPSPAPATATPTPPATSAAPPQTASAATSVPAPVPSSEATAGYGATVSAWLNSHKRYPDSARQRGEEGRAELHFVVDRTGHVIDYAIVKSSGYPDLDAAIQDMMRGAQLPPFPAGMTQPRFPITVTIRFSLVR
jgi:protein TonB